MLEHLHSSAATSLTCQIHQYMANFNILVFQKLNLLKFSQRDKKIYSIEREHKDATLNVINGLETEKAFIKKNVTDTIENSNVQNVKKE